MLSTLIPSTNVVEVTINVHGHPNFGIENGNETVLEVPAVIVNGALTKVIVLLLVARIWTEWSRRRVPYTDNLWSTLARPHPVCNCNLRSTSDYCGSDSQN